MNPERRRKYAVVLLIVSLILGHLNIGAYMAGWVSQGAMNAVTNYLSWMAITLTALDLLATTDVRVEQDDGSGGGTSRA